MEFGSSVSYVCLPGLYFEEDRDLTSFEVSCDLAGTGMWEQPRSWPRCVETVHCEEPRSKYERGDKPRRELSRLANYCVKL